MASCEKLPTACVTNITVAPEAVEIAVVAALLSGGALAGPNTSTPMVAVADDALVQMKTVPRPLLITPATDQTCCVNGAGIGRIDTTDPRAYV